MAHPKMLDITKTALVVVDIQEAFRGAISDFPQLAAKTSIIVRGFRALDLPIIVTEQYPKGLGRTAEEVLFALPDDFAVVEKTTFSSCGSAPFIETLRKTGATQILLCGLETHICVNQTAHDLLNEGFEVHLLTDAVASRFIEDKKAGVKKMLAAGAVPASVEMALFELLRDSKHEKFKEIQTLII